MLFLIESQNSISTARGSEAGPLGSDRNAGKRDEAALRILLEIGFVFAGENAVLDRVPELDFHRPRVGSRAARLRSERGQARRSRPQDIARDRLRIRWRECCS